MDTPSEKASGSSLSSDLLSKFKSKTMLMVLGVLGVVLVPVLVLGILMYRDSKISAKDVTITNVTDTAFTVTWVSDSKYIGRVYYQEGNKGWPMLFSQSGKSQSYDDRDVELNDDGEYVQVKDGAKDRYTHHVTIRNLKPEKEYSFRIGGAINGKEAEVKTAKTLKLIEDIKTPDPGYGQVEGIQADDAFIIIFSNKEAEETGHVASTLISNNGTYSIDMNNFSEKYAANKSTAVIESAKPKNIAAHTYIGAGYKPFETIVVKEGEKSANGLGEVFGISKSVKAESMIGDCAAEQNRTMCQSIGAGWYCGDGIFQANGTVKCVGPDGGTDERPSLVSVANIPASGGTDPQTTNDCKSTAYGSFTSGDAYCADLGETCTDGVAGINNRILCNGRLVDQGNFTKYAADRKADNTRIAEAQAAEAAAAAEIVLVTQEQCKAAKSPNEPAEKWVVAGSEQSCPTDNGSFLVENAGSVPGTLGKCCKISTTPVPADAAAQLATNYTQVQSRCDEDAANFDFDFRAGATFTIDAATYTNYNALAAAGYRIQFKSTDNMVGCTRSRVVNVPVVNTTWPAEVTTAPQACSYADTNSIADEGRYINAVGSSEYKFIRNITFNGVSNPCYRKPKDSPARPNTNSGISISDSCRIKAGNNNYEAVDYTGIHITNPNNKPACQGTDVNTGQITFENEDYVCCRIRPDAGLPSELIEKTSAQSVTPRGEVLGASDKDQLEVTENGRYVFFQNGEAIADQDIVVSGDKAIVKMFNDDNGNGIKDSSEKYFTDYSEIKLAKEASLETFNLNSGWNLINIPMQDTRGTNPVIMASDLIDYWNKQGTDIKHVARFRGGKFEIFSMRETGTQYAPDFKLLPGQAIFVLNLAGNKEVSFSGKKFESAVPMTLEQGWNLVGIVAPGRSYTSETLIEKMEDAGVKADTVSQFENGLYKSQVKEAGTVFGNSFKVLDKRGYFVRVSEGGGEKFTP